MWVWGNRVVLVRVLKAGKATGNKPALLALLVDKFGSISADQFAEIESAIVRGAAASAITEVVAPIAALPMAVPALQMAAPAPAEVLAIAPPPAVDVPVRGGDPRSSRRCPNLL